MQLYNLVEIVVGNMAEFADTGKMAREGAEFFETPNELVAIYNVTGVPYIVFQEEGTKYYDKNKGFIKNKAEGKINRFLWSEALGLPYDTTENDKVLLDNQDKLLVQIGGLSYD